MPCALAQQSLLCALMTGQADALAGSAPIRHDLWRLARTATALRQWLMVVESSLGGPQLKSLSKPARGVQRRLRRAMKAYAMTAMKGGAQSVGLARHKALAELGSKLPNLTETIAKTCRDAHDRKAAFEQAVGRPVRDMYMDWADIKSSA